MLIALRAIRGRGCPGYDDKGRGAAKHAAMEGTVTAANRIPARFDVILTPDLEDGGYTVTVPALPGCITDGGTIDEALTNAREAIELYLHGESDAELAAAGARFDLIVASVDVPAAADRAPFIPSAAD
jgi:predicted RNase H-like HicB family nuclease